MNKDDRLLTKEEFIAKTQLEQLTPDQRRHLFMLTNEFYQQVIEGTAENKSHRVSLKHNPENNQVFIRLECDLANAQEMLTQIRDTCSQLAERYLPTKALSPDEPA